ncbi:PDR/VanB family oxidoreductase [Pelagibius marinus]|uniref:PDR/VanB family oxidoreductase n=1 Tax=Pelagibius marinus TaxID=2762760 RepID=UPI00187304C6|nr:PDR/VanB family oxidoreductase [Pelagibius marinus]
MKADSLDVTGQVAEIRDVASSIRMIRFDVPSGILNLEAGAHVTFDVPKGDRIMTRSYSVVDDGRHPDKLTIAVKSEEQSKGGSRYMWSLEPGDSLHISANGNAMPPTYLASDFVVLAGGIGVTPMTGMARTLKRTGKPVRMIYCARSAEEAAFVSELREVLGDNLDMRYDSDKRFLDIPELLETVSMDTVVFMCGPQGLMEAMKSAWAERELPVQNLRYETFANSGIHPTRPFQVTVAETGRTIGVSEDETLLDALLASGHDVLSDCRRGECGLCKVHVVEATADIDHRDVFLSPMERARNDCLCACVSRLNGGHMTVNIDDILHGRTG